MNENDEELFQPKPITHPAERTDIKHNDNDQWFSTGAGLGSGPNAPEHHQAPAAPPPPPPAPPPVAGAVHPPAHPPAYPTLPGLLPAPPAPVKALEAPTPPAHPPADPSTAPAIGEERPNPEVTHESLAPAVDTSTEFPAPAQAEPGLIAATTDLDAARRDPRMFRQEFREVAIMLWPQLNGEKPHGDDKTDALLHLPLMSTDAAIRAQLPDKIANQPWDNLHIYFKQRVLFGRAQKPYQMRSLEDCSKFTDPDVRAAMTAGVQGNPAVGLLRPIRNEPKTNAILNRMGNKMGKRTSRGYVNFCQWSNQQHLIFGVDSPIPYDFTPEKYEIRVLNGMIENNGLTEGSIKFVPITEPRITKANDFESELKRQLDASNRRCAEAERKLGETERTAASLRKFVTHFIEAYNFTFEIRTDPDPEGFSEPEVTLHGEEV